MTRTKDNKYVVYWLVSGCILIFLMVIIGGITRLTHSGLSISNYKLISGTLPPLNESEWEAAFELYKQYPEYQKLNNHFNLQDYKDIYFWEWLHRLIGRLIGIIFIIPFLYFLITKQLTKSTQLKSLVLFGLGALQGFLGWYMVKSGLIDRPDVSHVRLAAHLITAFLTFAFTLWVILDIVFPEKMNVYKPMRNLIRFALLLVIIQIIYGAFVAGLDAGLIHNHWPLMSAGKFMHETVYTEYQPLYLNFIEGKSGIQFIHRILAIIVVLNIFLIWWKSKAFTLTYWQRLSVNLLLMVVCIQFLLGVLTLLYRVPLVLGIAHQIGAFLLLSIITFTLHRFSK